jgi:hypothetical protein
MSYEKHGRGMIAVNLVHNFLIKQGYQVFSEDQSQGMIDLVAINEDGDMLLIDVEFVDWERGGGGRGKGVIDTRLCRNK